MAIDQLAVGAILGNNDDMDIDQIIEEVTRNTDIFAEVSRIVNDLDSWGNIGMEEEEEQQQQEGVLDLPGAVDDEQQQADGGGVAVNSCAAEAGGVRALGGNRGGHDDDDDRDEPIPSPQPQPQEEDEDENAGDNGAVLMQADNVVVPSASSKKSENRIKNKKNEGIIECIPFFFRRLRRVLRRQHHQLKHQPCRGLLRRLRPREGGRRGQPPGRGTG